MLSLLLAHAAAIVAPNTSLATTPTGYFGGNFARRDNASIAMLAKSRIVMIEKWEGRCWQECLAGGVGSPSCESSCNVESIIVDTLRRVKAVNPAVSGVLYLNTILSFPFYHLNGVLAAANALTIDSVTKKPIVIRNDEGMEGIFVFGFDTEAGKKIYIDEIRNLTKTGVVDGFFGDKWASGAKEKGGSWLICNHKCGNVTAEQAQRWNAGKAEVLEAVSKIVGDGPYFGNGNTFLQPP